MIDVKNLCVNYGKTNVLENINFKVHPKDYLCVIGENGAGKSTVIKSILGLTSINSGEIKFSPELNRKNIGYLPQHTNIQRAFPATVKEVVYSGFLNKCRLGFLYSKQQIEKANRYMEENDILQFINKPYADLSGGQQQKVLLTRALCATDKILIMDEPTTGLDINATKEFYKMLKNLNNAGTTIIMITHDMEKSIKYAKHVLYLEKTTFFYGSKFSYLEYINQKKTEAYTKKKVGLNNE